MIISHVTIIADSALCFNAILGSFGGNGATLEINSYFQASMYYFLFNIFLTIGQQQII